MKNYSILQIDTFISNTTNMQVLYKNTPLGIIILKKKKFEYNQTNNSPLNLSLLVSHSQRSPFSFIYCTSQCCRTINKPTILNALINPLSVSRCSTLDDLRWSKFSVSISLSRLTTLNSNYLFGFQVANVKK